MNHRAAAFVTSFAIIIGLALPSHAAPGYMGYSGLLYDTDGIPLDGSYAMVFRVYDDAMVGNELFEQTFSNVIVTDGYFYVLLATNELGNGITLESLFGDYDTLYLEVEVDTVILSPRQLLGAVPWSFAGSGLGNLSCPNDADVIRWSSSGGVFICDDAAPVVHDHDSDYSAIGHDHAGDYAPMSHGHDAGEITTGTLSDTRYSCYDDLVAESKIGASNTQVAAGDHTHNFSAHTHSANDIDSGTLGTTYFSAYSDLVAESAIGSNGSQVAAGNHTHSEYVANTSTVPIEMGAFLARSDDAAGTVFFTAHDNYGQLRSTGTAGQIQIYNPGAAGIHYLAYANGANRISGTLTTGGTVTVDATGGTGYRDIEIWMGILHTTFEPVHIECATTSSRFNCFYKQRQ